MCAPLHTISTMAMSDTTKSTILGWLCCVAGKEQSAHLCSGGGSAPPPTPGRCRRGSEVHTCAVEEEVHLLPLQPTGRVHLLPLQPTGGLAPRVVTEAQGSTAKCKIARFLP